MTAPDDSAKQPVPPVSRDASHTQTVVFADTGSVPMSPPSGGTSPPPVEGEEGLSRALGWPVHWERYRCVRLLGVGGMGRVFEAWDARLRRPVAIKLLNADHPDAVQRFLREAQAQARIEHPGVCKVYEVGEVGTRPYIAMQLIHGSSLAQLAVRLSLEQHVVLLKQVAEAVAAAHGIGLIHRDLKPANIMVEAAEDGCLRPFVVDFGLVRDTSAEGVTATGATLGTPAFMSPEQATGHPDEVDRRTDVYSLGATLYTVLAGRPPFEGSGGMEILLRVVREEPTSLRKLLPRTPPDLDTIVMRCLEKEPSRRYDSARALAADLGRFLDGEPIAARRPSVGYVLLKKLRKNKVLSTVVATALAATLALGGLWIEARRSAARQAELAQRFGQRIEQVQGFLWRESSLELHDIRPARAHLRDRLKEIEVEMGRHGSSAAGPGHAALGRGFLALDEDEIAVAHLRKAWESGFRTPEVAYSLGLGLGRMYQQELNNVRRIQDQAHRERRRAEAQRMLRDPALQYLRSCSGSDAAPAEYVQGLVDFYEGRHEQALGGARAALAKVHWLHDAPILMGDVFLEKGIAARERGDTAAALSDLESAEAAYRRAVAIARSDPRCYLRMARVWDAMGEVRRQARSGDLDVPVREGMKAAQAALVADADSVEAHVVNAGLAWTLAEARLERGQDPTSELDTAERSLREALSRQPDNARANLYLGVVEHFRGAHEIGRGEDGRARLRSAIAAYERAVAKDPTDGSAPSNAALSFRRIASYEMSHGLDPTDSLEAAVRQARLAVQLSPDRANFLNSLATALLLRAEVEADHGRDCEAMLLEAIATGERAVAINSSDLHIANNLACAQQALGRARAARGDDTAGSLLEAAADGFRKAARQSPQYSLPWYNLGTAERDLARLAHRQGRDCTALLGRSRESLLTASRLLASEATVFDELARTELLAAEIEVESGRSPAGRLAEARRDLARALALDPRLAEAHLDLAHAALLEVWDARRRGIRLEGSITLAERAVARARESNPAEVSTRLMAARVGLERARWLLDRKRQVRGVLAEALASIDAALVLNPVRADAHAVQAALLLQQARAATTPAARNEALAAAGKAAAVALSRNPRLEPLFTADLAAAGLV